MNIGALVLVTAGLSLAYAGRQVSRDAEENDDVVKALVGLGMFLIGVVGVILGAQIMAATGA